MPEPVVFISHLRVKPGKLPAFRQMSASVTPALEAEKPDTVAFLAYTDASESRVTIVHVFGSADAMDAHFVGADERARAAYEYVEPDGWAIYGTANPAVLEGMSARAAAAGVSLTVEPVFVGGFLRLASDRASGGR